MFKKINIVMALVVFFGVNTIQAQETTQPVQETKEKKEGAHGKMTSWPELSSFHDVMAKTFHPSEEGNLVPIKERSGELNKKAEALATSKVPAEFNKPEIVQATKELTTMTKQLDELVQKKATDEEITKQLSATHDTFHKIVGLCSKDGSH